MHLLPMQAVLLLFDGSGSSDVDGTITSYAWDFGDGNFGTGLNPPHTYTAVGNYTVVLTVTDDGGATATDTAVAADDAYSTDEDAQLTIAAPGVLGNDSDLDGDTLTAVVDTQPSSGTLTLSSDGSFTYSPDPNFNGSDSFTYHANDSMENSNVATVTISVNPVNDPPVATADAYSTDEDVVLTVTTPGVLSNDSDIDVDMLSAVVSSQPSNGTLTLSSDGSFTYSPDINFNDTDFFTYLTNDGMEDSNVSTVTITVNAINDTPVAINDSYSTEEDLNLTVAALGVLANDSDLDGDILTTVVDTQSSSGTLTLNPNGSFTYSPDPNFNGSDSFTYLASDGLGNSNVALVTITVHPVNDAPVTTISAPANGQIFTQGDLITFTGTAFDAEDGDVTANQTWESDINGPIGTGGTFSRSDLSVGTHTITAMVIDSAGLTAFENNIRTGMGLRFQAMLMQS
jgi:VCBS repeat-containing protein